MSITINRLIFLAAFLTTTIACSCIRLPPFRKALEEYKNSSAPYAVATAISEQVTTDINGRGIVNYTIRAEGCRDTTVVATSPANGASCGVSLRLNERYVMRLRLDGTATPVDLCEVIRLYNSLSPDDRAFVDSNITSRCAPRSCPVGRVWRNGECISECSFVHCPEDAACRLGKCAPKCATCAPQYFCHHRHCHIVPCPPCQSGYECEGHVCIPA